MHPRSTLCLVALVVGGASGCISDRAPTEAAEVPEPAHIGRRFRIEIIGAW